MDEREMREQFEYAWKNTRILRPVERSLFTFGDTTLPYYVVAEAVLNKNHTVVREGKVVVKKPLIYTPDSDHPSFEGFGERGKEPAFFLIRGIYTPPYKFQNDSKYINIAQEPLDEVVRKLNKELDNKNKSSVAIIKGISEMWEISVMRYSMEMIAKSVPSNLTELREKGLLPPNFPAG